MSKRQRSDKPPNDDAYADTEPCIPISKLIADCNITPYDGGNNTTKIQIEFPHYFHLISPSIQQRIINAISTMSIEKPIVENLQK